MKRLSCISPRIVCALLAFLSIQTASAQGVIYVDDDAAIGGDGAAWATAFTTLQEALDVAGSGDEIRVAAGLYIPLLRTELAVPRTETFLLAEDLAIKGGYAGLDEPSSPNRRHFVFYESILSGDLHGDDDFGGDDSENAYHVITADGVNASAILEGFTIVAGNADDGMTHSDGGGIYLFNAAPLIRNCIFRLCEAYYGGGVYADASTPQFVNCSFLGNTALIGGGIHAAAQSDINVINGRFIGNAAIYGGATYFYDDCEPSIVNSTFCGNDASWGANFYASDFCEIYTANSILWGNLGPAITEDVTCYIYMEYSCIQDGWSGDGDHNTEADPGFLTSPTPGSDSEWGTADDDYGDVHPASGGVCVDSGSNDAVPSGIMSDCSGNPRFFDDPYTVDGGQGTAPIVDMGAIERVDCNDNNVPDDLDIIRFTCEDCNSNGAPDECDIASGASLDENGNGIPDECEAPDCPGDLNGDLEVNLSDLATLLGNYGTPSGAAYEDGDLDGDGDVDLGDLAALLGYYGTTC